jgi:hypothetical protein
MVNSLKYTLIHASFASRVRTATSRDKIGTSSVALMALALWRSLTELIMHNSNK